MRPLIRPAWRDEYGRYRVGALVAQAFGLYCATCERPLTSSVLTWHAPTANPVGGPARRETWDSALPLCGECATATAGRQPPGDVLLPDRDVTFKLGSASPFGYERRAAVARDAAGNAIDAVVVVGTTEEARATIRYFNLNTSSYDEETGRFTLPATGLTHSADPRVELRTKVWDMATSVAPILRHEDPTYRAIGAREAHLCMYGVGFWSVWATVLWSELGDLAEVIDLLAPGRGIADLAAAPDAIRADTPQRGIPGTSMSWLPDDDGTAAR